MLLLTAGLVTAAPHPARAQPAASDGRELSPEDGEAQADAPKPRAASPARRAAQKGDDRAGLKQFSKEWWDRQKQQDDAEGARLNRQMSICRGCGGANGPK
jgi:hypothetical protein